MPSIFARDGSCLEDLGDLSVLDGLGVDLEVVGEVLGLVLLFRLGPDGRRVLLELVLKLTELLVLANILRVLHVLVLRLHSLRTLAHVVDLFGGAAGIG